MWRNVRWGGDFYQLCMLEDFSVGAKNGVGNSEDMSLVQVRGRDGLDGVGMEKRI